MTFTTCIVRVVQPDALLIKDAMGAQINPTGFEFTHRVNNPNFTNKTTLQFNL